ncbi:MAG TPA: CinA family protein [Stellaceae bacterium]|jgi:PncC family amidohydrolase|nr:CinA family protein [Stellaceae bacterium]
MEELLPLAAALADRLKARGETIAVAESSTGGLISAALLAIPGASAYFIGGAVIYTRKAGRALFDVPDAALKGMRSATEPYALLLARTARERFGTAWAVAESGAAGPTGNRYGDAAGHCALAIAGPEERTRTLETGSADRRANMTAFAAAALTLLREAMA